MITTYCYQGHEIRVIEENGQVWWVLRDVCNVLKLSSPHKVAERLDEDEKGRNRIPTLGGSQELIVITESGLYNVILRSDKPEAKSFKRWITHDVLPSIRKHGAYLTPSKLEEVMNDPDAWIEMLHALKKERAEKEKYRLQMIQDKPKVAFADAVSASDGCILIGELAKILRGNGVDIGQNRLFEWLRQNGYLVRRRGSDYNSPTQKAMELGLFKVKESIITLLDGQTILSRTAKVTGKGQRYFISLFLNEMYKE